MSKSEIARMSLQSGGRRPCIFFNTPDGCRNGESCAFDHIPRERMPVCSFYGSFTGCSYGDSCGLRHVGQEQRKFEISIPDERSSCNIVDSLVEECTEWDEVKEDEFELDSGEKVESKSRFKYLYESKEFFIHMRQVIVNGKMLYEGSKMVEGSDETKGTASRLNIDDAKLLNRIDSFLDEKRRITKALPYFQKILAKDYDIDSIATENTLAVKVRDEVVFGDIKDITKLESRIQADTKKIKRPFYPGQYFFTVARPFGGEIAPIGFFHHADVDPGKLAKQFINMPDANRQYKAISNALTRHDFCKWTYRSRCSDDDEESEVEYSDETDDWKPGSDDSDLTFDDSDWFPNSDLEIDFPAETEFQTKKESTVYFLNSDDTKNMRKSIKHGNKRKSTEIPELFSVEADGTNKVLALGADFDKWNYGDEICGKLFQDKTSGRYFAFMIHSPEEQAIFQRIPQRKLKDLFPNHKFSSVQETKLMFEMKEFLKEKIAEDDLPENREDEEATKENTLETNSNGSADVHEKRIQVAEKLNKDCEMKYLGYKLSKVRYDQVKCGLCRKEFKTNKDGNNPKALLAQHYKEMLSTLDNKHMRFFRKWPEKYYLFFMNCLRRGYELYCHGCHKFCDGPVELLKHISLRMRQKKRVKCAKKHREIFADIVKTFVDHDMGYFSENKRMEKLASLMISDGGTRINFTSKTFDDESEELDEDDDEYLFGMSEDDQYELLCQGIMPWDPCALSALQVLNDGW